MNILVQYKVVYISNSTFPVQTTKSVTHVSIPHHGSLSLRGTYIPAYMTLSVIPVQKPPLAVRAVHTEAQRGEKLTLLPHHRNCFVRRFCVGGKGE